MFYRRLSELSERDGGIEQTHAVEDAHANQAIKREAGRLAGRLSAIDDEATEPAAPRR